MWDLFVGLLGLVLTVAFTAAVIYVWVIIIAFCFPLIVVALVVCVALGLLKAIFDALGN